MNQREVSNICIVGLGRQGNVHLQAAIELKKMKLVGDVFAYDTNGDYVDEILQEFDFIKLDRLEDIPKVKNTYVLCAPSNVHDDIIQ